MRATSTRVATSLVQLPRDLAALSTLLCLACGGSDHAPGATSDPDASYVSLVEPSDWSSLARSDDPFIMDPDTAPDCLGPGFAVEGSYLEFDTGLCSWVTLSAAAREAVATDQGLRLVVSHYDLNAVDPAQGVARLWLGDCEAWSKIVPIPGPAQLYTEIFVSPCALKSGGPVRFHLHNHGQNNWQLRELSVLK